MSEQFVVSIFTRSACKFYKYTVTWEDVDCEASSNL